MNIQEYDLMNDLFQHIYTSQREISERTGYSLGKVNQSLAELKKEGYLTDKYTLTEKAMKEIEEKRPKNAVILAAGFGLRMIPINREIPKGLVEVEKEPLIERLIKQLLEAGIKEINVVVGFMKEAYEYLTDKYGVKLIVNSEYAEKNNIHSLNCAAKYLGNTYIVPCDIWCENNPFSERELYSWYMVTDLVDDESDVRVNRKRELVEVEPEQSGNSMIGISYLLKEDADKLRERMKIMCAKKKYNNAFWESALMEKGKMNISARVVSSGDAYEINTYEQLRELDDKSKQLSSAVLDKIAEVLECEVSELEEITTLKKGMTNRSFCFSNAGKRYIMRIPGEGTDQLINRKQEGQVYRTIKELHLSDCVRYFDEENGYKLTEYLEGFRGSDCENPDDVKHCMAVLRKFHDSNLKTDHTFDVFERLEFYKTLWNGAPSCYRDYEQTEKQVYELKKYLEGQPKRWTLCHIDANHDNFLIKETENPGEPEIHLIDWEYAGMQDADLDIAMYAIYAMYDREQTDALIDAYYTEGCSRTVRWKIYCYIAMCGLLWSNWCEFKHHQGVEFGEYSIRQYQYAKEYYKYIKNETKGTEYEF